MIRDHKNSRATLKRVKSSLVRTLGVLVVCAIGVVLSFAGAEYVRDNFTAFQLDPESGVRWYGNIVDVLRIGAILLSIFIATTLYLFLAYRAEADIRARAMLKDVVMAGSQFKALYELSPVPYVLVTHDGTIEEPNKAMLRLMKGTADQIGGKSLSDIFDAESAQKFDEIYERFRRNIPIADEEISVKRLDGASRDALFSLFHLQGGRKGWGLGAFVDITERKEIERAKTEFVSLAAHQLRSPISTIKWYAELITNPEAGTLTEKQQKYAEHIHAGANNMNELVHTLLNVSRLEMGTLPIAYEKTDIAALCDSIFEEIGPEAQTNKVELVRDYGTAMAFSTDPKLLRIVLQNLISNAVKYTPEGGKVTVRLAEHGRKLSIAVEDTGLGIPPEAQDKIFTKMYRADNVKQKVPSGNGLGLYMSKAITETLGGTISFTSTVGKGTTFRLEIPENG